MKALPAKETSARKSGRAVKKKEDNAFVTLSYGSNPKKYLSYDNFKKNNIESYSDSVSS